MASHQSLREELECPVCQEYPKDPKVMGKCLHAACLDCLKKLVADRCSNSFPCPVCREKCMVPSNGVIGLKDDFRLRTLVEKYQMMIADMTDKSLIQCAVCPNTAFHLCKKCGNIYMCRVCSRKHSRRPLTADHELVGICSKHGKRVDMFCRGCNAAICSACLIADHSTDSHNVVPYQGVVEEAAEIVEAVEKLDRTRRERKIAALGNIIDIRDSVVATINSDLIEIGKQSDSAIELVRNKHSQLKAESNGITEQSEEWMKRKNAVDKEIVQTEQKEASLRQQKEEFSNYLNLYREACMNEFLEAMTQAEAESDKIKTKVDLGYRLTSAKPLLDDLTVPKLLKVKQDLTNAITAAQEGDGVAQYVNAKENMTRFVPDSAPTEIGRLIRRKFARMEKFADIFFPPDRSSERIFSIKFLADGRLASLYQSNMSKRDYYLHFAISLHELATPAVPQIKMISENIQPTVDMTVTPTGELMVLKITEPPVRAFKANSGFRDLNISAGESLKFRSIETDEEGNIFVADKVGHIYAFNPEGALINKVEAVFTCFPRMAYCGLTRTLYITTVPNIILRYHWDGSTFKTMPPFTSHMDTVCFTDVSVSNDGEVFAAGRMMSTGEVMVFQVVETKQTKRDGTTELEMIKLTFDDKVSRKLRYNSYPNIHVLCNTLALGLGDKVELFQLKP